MISTSILAFSAVALASVGVCLAFARLIRGITFIGVNTDNEKQVRTAARAHEWRWPSDMHKYIEGGVRTRMKDVAMLGLVAMQRLTGDRTSDYPIVLMCALANSISSGLIFLIAQIYWSTGLGLLLWGLFLTSFWPYQVALYGGYHCVSQMFFLMSAYLLQHAELASAPYSFAWLWAAGAFTCLMLFSSSASRKFLPPLLGAFLFSQRDVFNPLGLTSSSWRSSLEGVGSVIVALIFLLPLSLVFIRLSYRQLVRAIYLERAPGWLNRMIVGRATHPLEHYLNHAERFRHALNKLAVGTLLWLVVSLILTRSISFYIAQLIMALGACSVIVALTYPDIIGNLWAYYFHMQGSQDNHFRIYTNYFAKIGKPIKDNMRGAGFKWVVLFFWRMAPFHSVFYLFSLCFIAYILVVKGFQPTDVWKAVGMILLSLSPVLMGEMTRGPQIGRSYLPGLAGQLLLIGYATFQFSQVFSGQALMLFWSIATIAVLSSAGWNGWVFVEDIWPARMAPAWLGKTLENLGIREFYTYNIPYNHAFVEALRLKVPEKYKTHFINTLAEVKEGYIAVPGTSAKAVNMESERCARENGDFDLDPILNRLIESKLIARYAVASFKTVGTSRMWVHENEVTSYRDLILREINEYDRWRGRAWILDAGKLNADARLGNTLGKVA